MRSKRHDSVKLAFPSKQPFDGFHKHFHSAYPLFLRIDSHLIRLPEIKLELRRGRGLAGQKIFHTIVFAMFFFFLVAMTTAFAQVNQSASLGNPNQLTALGPVGSPAGTPVSLGINTSVNVVNGSASVDIPLLSIPQRGGSTLRFNFHQGSNILEPNIMANGGGGTPTQDECGGSGGLTVLCWEESIAFTATLANNTRSHVNMPRLYASNEYYGLYVSYDGSAYPQEITPVYCLTNWVFVDWDGNAHPLGSGENYGDQNLAVECSNTSYAFAGIQGGGVIQSPGVGVPMTSMWSDDGLYKLDASQRCPQVSSDHSFCSPGSMTVTSVDGTSYTFPFQSTWPLQVGGSYTGSPGEHSYDKYFAAILDRNGNTITQLTSADENGNPVYTVTDTLGRPFIINSGGLTYADSNGASQTISWSAGGDLSTKTLPDSWSDLSCTVNSPGTLSNPQYSLISQPTFLYPDSYYYITYPPAYGQTARRTVTIMLDALREPIRIIHPEGGYTSFSYDGGGPNNVIGDGSSPLSCIAANARVVKKAECDSASISNVAQVSCNDAEVITKYGYNGPGLGGDQLTITEAFNTPLARTTTEAFVPSPFTQGIKPQQIYEVSSVVTDQSGTIKTTNSYFGPVVCNQSLCLVQSAQGPQYPTTLTETIYASTGPLSTVKSFSYETPTSTGFFRVIGESDKNYDGSLISSKTTQWMSGGNYDASTKMLLTFPQVTTVIDGSKYAESTSTTLSYDLSGNITGKTVSGSNAATQTTSYLPLDQYGRPQQITDPLGHITKLAYGNNWSNASCAGGQGSTIDQTNAYLTSVTNPRNQITSYVYNQCTGSLALMTDANLQPTGFHYDPLGRIDATCYPDSIPTLWNGGACAQSSASLSTTYNDAQGANSVTSVKRADPNPSVSTVTLLDGLGRTSKTTLGSPAVTETLTTYDALSRIHQISMPYNPYTSSASQYDIFSYDSLDRPVAQSQPDGTYRLTCYGSLPFAQSPVPNCPAAASTGTGLLWEDSTDESGNTLRRGSDGGGRLTQVLELGSLTDPRNYQTIYNYDGFGNLHAVSQNTSGVSACQSTRSFSYDGMSRLTLSCNPEAGSTSYSYDLDGNLQQKVDARNYVTAYQYDDLNRLIRKTVPLVNATGVIPNQYKSTCYQYDSITGAPQSANLVGHLVAEWTQSGNNCAPSYTPAVALTSKVVLTYDPMGRPRLSQQCILAMCQTNPFSQNQTYDLAGDMTSWTDGLSSRTLNLQFDLAGRPISLTGDAAGNPASSVIFSVQGYTPAGSLQNWSVGQYLNFMRSYDSRLRVQSETVTH